MSKCTCAFPCGGTTSTCPSAPEKPETIRQWFDRNRDTLSPEMVASMERAFSYTGKQIETLGHKLIAAGGDLMFNPGQVQPAKSPIPVGEMISNDGDIYWADKAPPMGTKLYTGPVQPAKCQNCGATTGEACHAVGCNHLEAGNGEPAPDLCQDEGCPHHGTDHACLPKRDGNPDCKHAHMLPLFNAKREIIDYLCANCSHRTGGPTQTFTVFCRESNNEGTTWIGAVQARDTEEAGDIALEACAAEWSSDGPTWSPDDIIVLGVAEGDVKILEWNEPE